jgi:plastocyanin
MTVATGRPAYLSVDAAWVHPLRGAGAPAGRYAMIRLLVLVGAVLVSSTAIADAPTVAVGHNRLTPSEITVKPGTSVTFENQDEMPGGHTIVADDGSFQSPGLAKGETWSHTFDAPGTHGYSIKEHPAAKGSVTVE